MPVFYSVHAITLKHAGPFKLKDRYGQALHGNSDGIEVNDVAHVCMTKVQIGCGREGGVAGAAGPGQKCHRPAGVAGGPPLGCAEPADRSVNLPIHCQAQRGS